MSSLSKSTIKLSKDNQKYATGSELQNKFITLI